VSPPCIESLTPAKAKLHLQLETDAEDMTGGKVQFTMVRVCLYDSPRGAANWHQLSEELVGMKRILLLTVGVVIWAGLLSGQNEEERYVPETDPLVLKNLEHWQDLKFGLLMHWGPYSQWGVVESWSICSEDEGWCRRKLPDYVEYKKEYEGLKKTFDPVNFDPSRWAKAARDAGMKYVVLTTKHHDGFCMFDSKYTDYKITSPDCPFHTNPGANVAKEVFDAFRKEGFLIGAYFSKPDWNSEYYWWPNFATPDRNVNYDPEQYPDRWNKFVEFTHNQITELMGDYGRIDILWLDGGWVAKKSQEEIQRAYLDLLSRSRSGFIKSRTVNQDIRMDELAAKCRQKQPGLIVVDRAVYGKNQNYLTPENRVPDKALPYPWESCITSGGGWSFTPNAKYMSARQAVHLLVDIVSKGGNLLLNIAPGPDGTWQPGAYDLLKEIGAWIQVNSEAVYGSRPIAPYKEGNVCMTRQNNANVFFLYLAGENESAIPREIRVSSHRPAEGAQVTVLGSNSNLPWKADGSGFVVTIPNDLRVHPPCRYAWTIKVSSVR
jgi:alpha-L-fucosidase